MTISKKKVRVAIVLMASGFGKRYGSNKLLETLNGRPLFTYGVEQALGSGADRVIVVTRFPEIREYVKKRIREEKTAGLFVPTKKAVEESRIQIIKNPYPQKGISESLKLGLRAAADCDGCCFMVCDQPLLKINTIKKVLDSFRKDSRHIYLCRSSKGRGNPVVFPADYYEELFLLEGDQGGKRVLERYPEQIREIHLADPAELEDMDEAADFQVLEEKLRIKLRESI